MKQDRWMIRILTVALLASNAWWLYHAFDIGVTVTLQNDSLKKHHKALAQTLAILPVAARIDSNKAQVIDAAKAAAPDKQPFEKDGFIWIGKLGLRFGKDGRLTKAVPAWEPF